MRNYILFEHASDSIVPPMRQMRKLEHLSKNGGQNTCEEQKHKSECCPHEGVDNAVVLCEYCEKLIHGFKNPFSKKLREIAKKQTLSVKSEHTNKQFYSVNSILLCPFA